MHDLERFLWQEAPAKIVMGGKPNNAPPPPMQKRRPPHTRKNGMAPAYMERKDCPHKNTPIGETPPPPQMDFFLFVLPPPGERLYPPLRAPIMIYMISTHFIPFVWES